MKKIYETVPLTCSIQNVQGEMTMIRSIDRPDVIAKARHLSS